MRKVDILTPFDNQLITHTVGYNLKYVLPYNAVQASYEVDCVTEGFNMPELVAKLVVTIKNRYPGIPMNSIINLILVKIAQMLTAKRIKYVEHCKVGYPNYYAIIFMISGAGKDKLSNELDNFVFYPFREWFKFNVQARKDKFNTELQQSAVAKFSKDKQELQRKSYIKEKLKEFRNMIIEVSDGTREGLYCDAKAFKSADFGSLMVKIAEFGQYLTNMTTEQKLFLNTLFEGYDGIIRSQCIKGERREESVEDLPVNALLYSDPTMFKNHNVETMFNNLMETGLGRRCVITFMCKKEPYEIEKGPQKAYKSENKYYQDLKAIGEKLFKVFDSVTLDTQYELQEKTYTQSFYPYRIRLEELANKEDNSLLDKEIISRELKALKLSTIYACLNHPAEFYISQNDMEQAIDTVEMLSKDFKSFLNYKPKRYDKYDKFYNFLAEHINEKFGKTQLVCHYYSYSGLSRDKFRSEFEKYMEVIAEMATQRGTFLEKTPINHNSGYSYSLIYLQPKNLSDKVIPLDTLLNG